MAKREFIEQKRVITCLENTAKYYDMPQADEWTKGIHYGLLHGVDNILDNVPAVTEQDIVKPILDKIRAEISDFEEEVFNRPNTDYSDYAAVRHCLEIIDKYKAESEG